MLDLNKPLVFAATGHRAYYIGMSKEGRIVVETETGHLSSIHPQNSHLLENVSAPVYHCIFCEKSSEEVPEMIVKGVSESTDGICKSCVEVCAEVLTGKRGGLVCS